MRNLGSILATVTGLLIAGGSVAAAAGHPHERQGWLFGAGVGGGSAEVISDAGRGDRRGGASAILQLAYAFHPQLSVGVGTSSWIKIEDGQKIGFTVLGPVLNFYPGARGFVLRAGAGLGQAEVETVAALGTAYGAGLTAGAGYEFRLGRRLALGPMVDVGWTFEDTFQTNHVTGSLTLTWYELKR